MSEAYRFVTGRDRDDLIQLNGKVTGVVWPEFMLHDPVAELFTELYEKLPQFQFALLEPEADSVVVLGNCIPLAYAGTPDELPDTGWDWAMEKGIADCRAGKRPTVLCALQIAVANAYRGKGLSGKAVEMMRSLGRAEDLHHMFAPVRPSAKADYPLIPIDDYINWHNDDGLPFDPWMRVHARSGARTIKVCQQAMRITGTVAQWQEWTGMSFPQSGQYVIPGALTPVDFDVENDSGVYVEPNVWMQHNL